MCDEVLSRIVAVSQTISIIEKNSNAMLLAVCAVFNSLERVDLSHTDQEYNLFIIQNTHVPAFILLSICSRL